MVVPGDSILSTTAKYWNRDSPSTRFHTPNINVPAITYREPGMGARDGSQFGVWRNHRFDGGYMLVRVPC